MLLRFNLKFAILGSTVKLQFNSRLFLTWESIFRCTGNRRAKTGSLLALGTTARKGYVFYYLDDAYKNHVDADAISRNGL